MKRIFLLLLLLTTAAHAQYQPRPVTSATSTVSGSGSLGITLSISSGILTASGTIPTDTIQLNNGAGYQKTTGTTAALSDGTYGVSARQADYKIDSAVNLRRAFSKLARMQMGETTQLTIMATGDSVAEYEIQPIAAELQSLYGNGGYALNSLLYVTGSGAVDSWSNFSLNPSGRAFTVPAGGYVQWAFNNSGSLANLYSELGAAYVVSGTGGAGVNTYKIQVMTNNGSWTDVAVNCSTSGTVLATGTTMDTYQPGATIGLVTTGTFSGIALRQFRLVGVTGTTTMLGARAGIAPGIHKGIVYAGCSQGGIDIGQGSTVPAAIWGPVLYDLNPDLISCKFYDSDTLYNTYLPAWQALFTTNSATLGTPDFLFIGCAPTLSDPGSALNAQDIVAKNWAISNGYMFWSPRHYLNSWSDIAALGWNADSSTHLTIPCQQYTAGKLYQEAGLAWIQGARFGSTGFLGEFDTSNSKNPGVRCGSGSFFYNIFNTNPTPSPVGFVLKNTNVTGVNQMNGVVTFRLNSDGSWSIDQSNGLGIGRTANDTFYLGVNGSTGFYTRNGATYSVSQSYSKTIIGSGTTGNQTMNTTTGQVRFAAGATSLTVTNNLCTASSIIQTTLATNDAMASSPRAVAASGSFTLYLGTAPTAETAVNFTITN